MSSRSLRVFLRSSSCSVRNLCRSSIAENSSSASGLTLPSIASARSAVRSRFCLLLADVRHGLGLGGVGLSSACASGSLRSNGTSWSGPYSATSAVGVEAELLERALLELLDPHPLLGAGHLVAVHGVDQLVVLAGQVAQPARGRRAAACSRPCAGLLDRGAGLGGPVDRDLEPVEHDADRDADRLGGPALAEQPLAALDRAGAGLALGLGGAEQLVGPAVQRAGPLLGGAQRQPGVHLGLAGGAGGLGEPLAVVGRAPRSGASSARASRSSSSASPARSWSRASSASAIARSSRSASPRAAARPGSRTGRAPRRPRPASRRTRAAWPGRRRPAAGPRAARSRAGRCRSRAARRRRPPRRAAGRPRRPRPGSRCRLGWLAEPPAAKWAPSTSPSRVTAVTSA